MPRGFLSGRAKKPVPIGAALKDLTRRLGISRTLTEYSVITSWKELVGEKIARVALPQRIEKGILFVSVASAPWRAELTMRRREILEMINAKTGTKVLKDIRFR
jgi:predicted nucleic acid-binding Zn ribbon protein